MISIRNKKNVLIMKKLITFATLISLLSSCSVSNDRKVNSNQTYALTMSYNNNLEEYLNRYGIVTENLRDGTIYIREFKSRGILNKIVYSIYEFQEYLPYENVSFEDVRTAILENEYICEYFKVWLDDYVNKLENVKPDVNLSVFYYNLMNLKIREISREEMNEISLNAVARFDAKKQEILYVENISKDTFFHEVSHMFTDAYMMYGDSTLIHKTMALGVPVLEDGKLRIRYLFNGVLEGSNELFTSNINTRKGKSAYSDFVSSVQYYLDILDIDVYQLEEEGIVNFTNKLIDNKIDACVKFNSMDDEFNNLSNGNKVKKLKM